MNYLQKEIGQKEQRKKLLYAPKVIVGRVYLLVKLITYHQIANFGIRNILSARRYRHHCSLLVAVGMLYDHCSLSTVYKKLLSMTAAWLVALGK